MNFADAKGEATKYAEMISKLENLTVSRLREVFPAINEQYKSKYEVDFWSDPNVPPMVRDILISYARLTDLI